MSRRAPILALISLLLVALLAACGGKALGSETTGKAGFRAALGYDITDYPEGQRKLRPAFRGTTFDGKEVSQSTLRGSVVVVNFWASWCGPCRKEERNLQALSEKYGPKGAMFLGINTRDTKADARSFLSEFGVTYPSVFDPYAKIAYKFRVVFLPVTYVLDKTGRVAAAIIGATEHTEGLERILDRELAR